MAPPAVTVFGPHPLLTVTIEARGAGDDVHLHAGGQGVWVARMAGELGAHPVLCGLAGGEMGAVIAPLLEQLPGERRLVPTAGGSGCLVTDRRAGNREFVAQSLARPPSRHELDELFAVTVAAALRSRALVVCNPYPGDTLPLEVYASLIADVRAHGVPVIVDLSSPRLDAALDAAPDLVKLNDWELAGFVRGPVRPPDELRSAAHAVRAAGARRVVVTRAGEPALVCDDAGDWELVPPAFERGAREGCGDSMVGAVAAGIARGMAWRDALVLGAAAGAGNFLRHGLGTGSRPVIEELAGAVTTRAA